MILLSKSVFCPVKPLFIEFTSIAERMLVRIERLDDEIFCGVLFKGFI
jgi:hypothetical protein